MVVVVKVISFIKMGATAIGKNHLHRGLVALELQPSKDLVVLSVYAPAVINVLHQDEGFLHIGEIQHFLLQISQERTLGIHFLFLAAIC